MNTKYTEEDKTMGGRGAFSTEYGGIPIEEREYSCIAVVAKIKVLQCDTKKNNPTITYSNTKNTTYFAFSKERDRIEKILYYRDHKLIKCVEFKNNEIPHTHYYKKDGDVIWRKRHDHTNEFGLNERDKRLMKAAKEFNNKRIKNKLK